MPVKDVYDQFMVFDVTQSAANTLTFAEVSLGVSLFEYAALIISRIEYAPGRPGLASLQTNADFLELAITGSNSITDLSLSRPEVYDRMSLNVLSSGTPASAWHLIKPVVKDFSTMVGGGLIVPAQNMYLGMLTGDFSAAQDASARVYYRVKAMVAADFIELVQRLRVLST